MFYSMQHIKSFSIVNSLTILHTLYIICLNNKIVGFWKKFQDARVGDCEN